MEALPELTCEYDITGLLMLAASSDTLTSDVCEPALQHY